MARYLIEAGVENGDLVGLFTSRSLRMVVGLLGILKAGGAYVPLDERYPAERLSFMLEDSGVRVLLTEERLLERLPDYDGRIVYPGCRVGKHKPMQCGKPEPQSNKRAAHLRDLYVRFDGPAERR